MSGHHLITMVGATLVLLGGWVMYQEAAPNLRGGTTSVTKIAAMPSGEAAVGLTVLSQHHALLDCDKTLRSLHSLEVQFMEDAQRERLPELCAGMAQSILSRNPADSFAWYISAAASAALGDPEGLNEGLRRSKLSGPNEGWIAGMRVQLAQRNQDLLASDVQADEDSDLALAASIPQSARALARLYIVNTELRNRMTAILDTMPPADQRVFLSAVQYILTTSGR